ncbi:hypothetical protein PGTUg99_006138 [Puccinia graminis f. sp. tritici]|uniref:Helicase ATP-binding domain-containing protein n=1 Tax=Puccinia graminis f. sp. tritici TaxID=56615 RepID=A0A5B0QDZ8_PUCGR|nr:hypothetical protein PGTUg99_006138 [Puccinia graminis f. sp. tritici]
MTDISCLGFFTTLVIRNSDSSNQSGSGLRDAVFHRGRNNLHILCSNYEKVGDLNDHQSRFLGPLIGEIGQLSEPLTSRLFVGNSYPNKVFLRLFYVQAQHGNTSHVHGFIFSPSVLASHVMEAFTLSNIQIKKIPNYQPSHFFGVRQINNSPQTLLPEERLTVPGCRTTLMDHQQKAVEFIQRSESDNISIAHEIWTHPDNEWVKQVFSKAAARGLVDKDIVFDSHGCILADDMGLGKTLTTLTTIQLSQNQAVLFANEKLDRDVEMRTPATLIICPLSTLDNWINEINTHFDNGSLPYQVFYGKERSTIQFQDISRVAIVLATYESVCISGIKESNDGQQIGTSDQGRKKKSGLNLSNVRWFRIVLDEAHYMKDPKTNRSIVLLSLKAQRRLCLTGTPMQNNLGDLHNLLKFLRLEPWSNNSIWKQCVELPVQLCDPRGILTLQNLMNGISMRRLKTTVLELPEKVERVINIELKSPWNQIYEKNHETFASIYGNYVITQL